MEKKKAEILDLFLANRNVDEYLDHIYRWFLCYIKSEEYVSMSPEDRQAVVDAYSEMKEFHKILVNLMEGQEKINKKGNSSKIDRQ